MSGQIIIETMTCTQVLKQLERAVRVNEVKIFLNSNFLVKFFVFSEIVSYFKSETQETDGHGNEIERGMSEILLRN